MILSPEALLEPVPGRFQEREHVSEAWASCRRAWREALKQPGIREAAVMVGAPGSGKSTWAASRDSEQSLIFDAVWSKPGRRRAMATQIRNAGKIAVAVLVKSRLATALERNAQRPVWRRVPEPLIRRTFLEILRQPPTRREGWHTVLVVDGEAGVIPSRSPTSSAR